MSGMPEYTSEDRNASNYLSLSLRFSEEYLNCLQVFRKRHSETEIQTSKELSTIHRALWTSLVVEIRKLFGQSFKTYKNHSLREISFFKEPHHKQAVDNVYGNRTIQKILMMSDSFTIHLGKDKKFISVAEICDSDLESQLRKLEAPIEAYAKYARENDPLPRVQNWKD